MQHQMQFSTTFFQLQKLCLDHSPSSLLPSYRALNTENAFLKHRQNPRYSWIPQVPEEGPTLHTAGKFWGGNSTQLPSSSLLLLAPDAGYFQAQDNTKAVQTSAVLYFVSLCLFLDLPIGYSLQMKTLYESHTTRNYKYRNKAVAELPLSNQ